MSFASHVMVDDSLEGMEVAPMLILFGAVLLLGILAAATGNLDMGNAAASLLIGP